MRKDTFENLIVEAQKVAEYFSNPERELNHNKEIFEIEKVVPLSEQVGAVIYKKNTGLRALTIFLLVNKGTITRTSWFNFFPTDSHVLGLLKVVDLKSDVEAVNGLSRKLQ